jgi:DNA-binding SARP family transcriptional activator
VLFAPNGKTAIDLPDFYHIDIVFISHVLNGTDGIMLLESFKKRFPSIPVVFIAEQPKVDEVITAFRTGARELLVKPIDEKELVTVTQKIFGFVSNQETKRKWFFSLRKKNSANNPEQNNNEQIKMVLKQSKLTENRSTGKSEDNQLKESIPLKKDSSHRPMFDTSIDSAQLNEEYSAASFKMAHPLIEAFFFGPFRVLVNNRPIENWPSKKGKSLFAYLLLNHKKKIFRDVLMDIFWQKSNPDSARNCLNVTIHGIRRVLEEIDHRSDYVLFKDECYYLNPKIGIWLDVEFFRKTWRNAQSIEHAKGLSAAVSSYQKAAKIYNGEFLEAEIYEDWSSLDRENLKEIYLVILDKISENCLLNNDLQDAISLCEKILEKDICREDIYRRLMTCYYHFGQRDKALRTYRKCAMALKSELEAEPTKTTIDLYREIITDRI